MYGSNSEHGGGCEWSGIHDRSLYASTHDHDPSSAYLFFYNSHSVGDERREVKRDATYLTLVWNAGIELFHVKFLRSKQALKFHHWALHHSTTPWQHNRNNQSKWRKVCITKWPSDFRTLFIFHLISKSHSQWASKRPLCGGVYHPQYFIIGQCSGLQRWHWSMSRGPVEEDDRRRGRPLRRRRRRQAGGEEEEEEERKKEEEKHTTSRREDGTAA